MGSDPLPPFLRLSAELRLKIYSYLLAPHSENEITTINYNLEWPFLEHPSSTTFTPHQLDRCRCPRRDTRGTKHRSRHHIYARYICQGPEVHFAPRSKPLWVLETPGSAFNILRPATRDEERYRPDAGVILVNKLIYTESLPLLYRKRNFLLITSICSRGRYEAYATQLWLARCTSFAKAQITTLSLICQENEEDCRTEDVANAYVSLSRFILDHLPRCHTLCLNVWTETLPWYEFKMLFSRDGMQIYVKTDATGEDIVVFSEIQLFLRYHGE